MSQKINIPHKMISILFVSAVLILMFFIVQQAFANERIENGGQVPFYARFGEHEFFHDGEWAVIAFYRSPNCIPSDFNMLYFFDFPTGPNDPGAFGCNPTTTDGFEIWETGQFLDPAPIQSVLHGKGAVPVWFVRLSEMEDAMSDHVVTIGELAGLPSLKTGYASKYSETLQPSQAANVPMFNSVAKGALDDGGSFKVHISWNAASDHRLVQINLDD